jgi:hypothetical protein
MKARLDFVLSYSHLDVDMLDTVEAVRVAKRRICSMKKGNLPRLAARYGGSVGTTVGACLGVSTSQLH